jgi:hypothetical protein
MLRLKSGPGELPRIRGDGAERASGARVLVQPAAARVSERLSPEGEAASPALEYLGHAALCVFNHTPTTYKSSITYVVAGRDRVDKLAARIRQAWASGDEWLRACAVRASRAVVGFDARLFAQGDDGSVLVRAELAALVGGGAVSRGALGKAQSC